MLDDIAKIVGNNYLVNGFRIDTTVIQGPACSYGADIGSIEVRFGISPLGNSRDLFEFFYNFLWRGIDANTVFSIKIMDGKIAVGNHFGGYIGTRAGYDRSEFCH